MCPFGLTVALLGGDQADPTRLDTLPSSVLLARAHGLEGGHNILDVERFLRRVRLRVSVTLG